MKSWIALLVCLVASPAMAADPPPPAANPRMNSPLANPAEVELRAAHDLCSRYRNPALNNWQVGYENCDKIEKALSNTQAAKDKNQIDGVAGKY